MGSKLTKSHLIAIALSTVLALVLVIIIVAKIAGKRVFQGRIKKARLGGENDISLSTKTHFLVLPKFPHGELRENYIQPSVFNDVQQVVEEEDDINQNSFYGYAGTLQINVRYDLIRSTLIVLLSKGDNLPVNDTDKLNYYIITNLFPQKDKSFQSCVHKTSTPNFNEVFEFTVPLEYLLLQSLKFSLWSFDRFSHHEIIADALLNLLGLEKYGLSISREICVVKKLRLVPKNEEGYRETEIAMVSATCGEIFLSLGYLRLAERLAVVVIKVIDLQKIDNETPDPFVKVSLLCKDRTLKTKKTSTKFKESNPMYNETLTFDVAAERLHETSLLFSVLSKVKDSSTAEILGKVLLGAESSGENFDHWDEVRTGSKPRGRWHKLTK